MKHYKFPKIRQYHQVIRDLKLQHQFIGKDEEGNPCYDNTKELPVVEFEGRIKLHGSNSAVVFDNNGNFYCQSRSNIIDENKDNAGFASWVNKEGHKIWENVKNHYDVDLYDEIVVYGEWCGGSIQKGVALNNLDKMFVIFAVRTIHGEDKEWQEFEGLENPEINVFNIARIPPYTIKVDLNNPQMAIDQMNKWVDEIDQECPFCKNVFGVSGHGEGLVFTVKGTNDFSTAYKVKGSNHSQSKVKKLPKVDPVKLENLQKAVELHCNEDRLEQGWNEIVLSEEDKTPKKIGDFVRWMVNDIWEEEGDSLRESNITKQEIGKSVSKKSANWFQNKLQEDL